MRNGPFGMMAAPLQYGGAARCKQQLQPLAPAMPPAWQGHGPWPSLRRGPAVGLDEGKQPLDGLLLGYVLGHALLAAV